MAQEQATGRFGAAEDTSKLLVSIIHSLSSSASVSERGKQKAEFEQRFRDSDLRLEQLVQANYGDLTAIIGGFTAMSDKIQDSRDKMKVVKESLSSCRQLLRCRRDELRKLWIEGVEQRTVNELLQHIEEVKEVPGELEKFMKDKHYLHATDLLVNAVNLLQGDLSSVEALRELRFTLIEKKEKLHEQLIEEIQCQLYVKAPSAILANKKGGGLYNGVSTPTKPPPRSSAFAEPPRKILTFGMPEVTHDVTESLTSDPEADPEHFLAVLVESLATLGKLSQAMKTIRVETQPQLLSIVQRASQHVIDNFEEDIPEGGGAGGSGPARALQELLSLVTRQFHAVARAHTQFSHHLRRVKKLHAKKYGDLVVADVRDVWKKVQNVVQHLLEEYLGSGGVAPGEAADVTGGSPEDLETQLLDIGSYFVKRRGPSRPPRKTPLFRFENSSQAISLQTYLRDIRRAKQGEGEEEREGKLKYVCKPDPKNITVIFNMLQKFIVDVENQIGCSPGTSPLQLFVTDFVKNRFLDQVQYNVSSTINIVTKGYEAFRSLVDHTTQKDMGVSRPLLHSTAMVDRSIGELQQLMQDLPSYADHFLGMVSSILRDYLATCNQQYSTMVHLESEDRRIISAAWAKDEDITRFLRSLPNWHHLHTASDTTGLSPEDLRTWNSKESAILTRNLSTEALIPTADIITDPLQLRTLANLHQSLEWFAGRIQWFLDSLPGRQQANGLDVDLAHIPPVSEEAVGWLMKEAREFKDLSEVCLIVLHLEVRVHCFHFLLPVAKQSNYWCGSEDMEPDSNVIKLNRDLSALEEGLATALTPRKLKYIFEGLGHLTAEILINSTQFLTRINNNGIKKMCRNIFALQQNLTNMTSNREVDLDNARRYYEMLFTGPDEIVKTVMEQGGSFSELEYVNALKLLHRSLSHSEKREGEHKARLDKLKQLLREYQV